ncbi:MAG: ferrochelatase [Candidatus Limnocylindria bacterium]
MSSGAPAPARRGKSRTTGVLLMTYGAPRGADDLPAYLSRVRGGKTPTEELVREMARRYDLIGGSPLVRITTAQAEALERELNTEGSWRVAAGMRYSEPGIGQAVTALRSAGAERVIGIVMSPQWSDALMGGYARALEEAAGGLPALTVRGWHREPAFIDALAAAVREKREALGASGPDAHFVLTAHSLPRRVFDAEPAYVAELRETADLAAARAGLEGWTWAYQSAGHTQEEWLRPDLTEVFPEIARGGHRAVLVVPVQFLADHLEVLYDLDVAAAEQAKAAGLDYHRVEMPNTRPPFIRALAGIARREALAPA